MSEDLHVIMQNNNSDVVGPIFIYRGSNTCKCAINEATTP